MTIHVGSGFFVIVYLENIAHKMLMPSTFQVARVCALNYEP